MKRKIVCPTCKKEYLFRSYPGEHIKGVDGVSKDDLVCDSCGLPIYFGDPCCAISMWADDHGIQYYPWEQEYLTVAAETVESSQTDI